MTSRTLTDIYTADHVRGIEADLFRGTRHYNSYTDSYLNYPQTFAQILGARVKTSLAFSRIKRFESTFEAKMFGDALNPEVFHVVLNVCRENRDLMRRYFRARAVLLGLPNLAEYDLSAPLLAHPLRIPYDEARQLVLKSLEPLGAEYVEVARRGLYEERWADVYPKSGKCSNAFSGGTYGTRPFFLLNYLPKMMEVGTLAHELGHSMHSYFTNRAQPFCYAGYSMSVAETASNLNQVLLRAEILKSASPVVALSVLEEAFYFVDRYLFLMPTMSEVEHKLHSRYAEGGGDERNRALPGYSRGIWRGLRRCGRI